MHYIEGTIDAIELRAKCVCFSILPSSEFLKTLDGGKKMALFIEDLCEMIPHKDTPKVDFPNLSSRGALLVDPTPNVAGKETLWFSLTQTPLCATNRVLVDVKNNRSVVRVRTEHPNKVVEPAQDGCWVIAAQSIRVM